MTKRRAWPVSLLILGLLVTLTGCGQITKPNEKSGAEKGKENSTKLSGNLKLTGSTTVLPIAQAAAERFMVENPGVKVDVQGTGSSEGIKAVSQGAADIGNSSRELKDDENNLGLVDHPIAIDAIVFVVNPSNRVNSLTDEQLKGIFTGKIKNWKEVGGDNEPIQLVYRDEASGTREVVQEKLLGKGAKFADDAIVQPGNGQVKATVAGAPNAIGYVSYGYLDATVKPLKFNGVEASLKTIKDKTYSFQRNLHMFTKGEPKDLAKAFIDFVLSEDFQKEVISKEYVPVAD